MQIVVLGMHRSGTSLVSGLLNQMGFYFGSDGESIGANQENPKGFWERRDVRDINDALLAGAGCDWDNISKFELASIPSTILSELRNRATQVIDKLNKFPDWFIKEPRLCLLFPFWRSLIEEPVCVLVERSPIEVALSLHRRNSIPVHVGLALWEKYTCQMLSDTSTLPKIVVSHTEIIENPLSAAGNLYHGLLSLGATQTVTFPSDQTIESYVSPGLRHHVNRDNEMEHYLNGRQLCLYANLRNAMNLDPGTCFEPSKACVTALFEYDNSLAVQKSKGLERQLDFANKTVAQKQAQIVSRNRSITEYKAALKESQRILSGMSSVAQALVSSRAWKLGRAIVSTKERLLLRNASTLADSRLRSLLEEHDSLSRIGTFDIPEEIAAARLPQGRPAPSLDIVICVHNALDDVKRCLESVQENTQLPCRLILVNDGSDDSTTTFLAAYAESHAGTVLLRNGSALGYTKAANMGLRQANADYVVCLNSDTIVPQMWFFSLLECFESNPKIGIVGPLSNAASWQSTPERFDCSGDWQVNELPPDFNLSELSELVYRLSEKRFPTVDFLNGFCLAIRKEVIDTIGYLDEASFPNGYGEENDFCLRARAAGYLLAIADQSYVYHAKSKSYSHERRRRLSAAGGKALKAKHGERIISKGAHALRDNADLRAARGRLKEYLDRRQGRSIPDSALRVLFVMPVKGGGGGAHSVIQEACGMRQLGIDVKVATLMKYEPRFAKHYPDLYRTRDHFIFFKDNNDLLKQVSDFHVVVATLWSTPTLIKPLARRNPDLLTAYYIQDYEPWFFDRGEERWRVAYNSYTCIPDMFLFAKTEWLCRRIEEKHGKSVHKVCPSLDGAIYFPAADRSRDPNKVTVTAMIRPSTPRRAPWLTLELLAKLKATQGDRVAIRIFGCSATELEEFRVEQAPDLNLDFDFQNAGALVREEVAALLRSSDVFVDFSEYQAFGRTGLEAMACGCVPVLPRKGGASEYASDHMNALLVDTRNRTEMYESLLTLCSNTKLREKLAVKGLETAKCYSIERAALSELSLFRKMQYYREYNLNEKTAHLGGTARTPVAIWPCTLKLSEEPTGSAYVRLILPLGSGVASSSIHLFTVSSFDELLAASPQICVVQRNVLKSLSEVEHLLHLRKTYGFKLIHEIDDDLFLTDGDEAEAGGEERFALEYLMRSADSVVTSSAVLRDRFLAKNTNSRVIANTIDYRLWKVGTTDRPTRPSSGPLRVFYMGTRTHHQDLEMIAPALEQIDGDLHGKVHITIVGGTTCPDRFPYATFLPIPPMLTYPQFVNWLVDQGPWDIGLIPLTNTPFNAGKSHIKFLDYSALGLAIVASEASAYSELAVHEHNCLLVPNTTKAWHRAILRLTKDHNLRNNLCANATLILQRHGLEQAAKEWVRLFGDLSSHGVNVNRQAFPQAELDTSEQ